MSRRLFVGGGLVAGLGVARARAETPPNAISPDAALHRLMEGNARYAANRPTAKDYAAGRAARAQVQYPIAAVLGCADSRVSPELAFDQGPGELFVVRVAGNLVTTDLLASLEYGIAVLNVPLVMVLGHSDCGAINATLKVLKDHATLPGHLPELVDGLKPGVAAALRESGPDLAARAVAANVAYNVERLRTAQPVFAGMVAQGKVKVVGAVYDLPTGHVKPM